MTLKCCFHEPHLYIVGEEDEKEWVLKHLCLLTFKKTSSAQAICHVIRLSGHHRKPQSNQSTDGRLL